MGRGGGGEAFREPVAHSGRMGAFRRFFPCHRAMFAYTHFAALRILCGCRPTLSPTDSELHDELFLEIVLRAEKRWHQIQRRQQVKRTQTGPT